MVGSGRRAGVSSVTEAGRWSKVQEGWHFRGKRRLADNREIQEGCYVGGYSGLRVVWRGRKAAVSSVAEVGRWSGAAVRLVSQRWRRLARGRKRQESWRLVGDRGRQVVGSAEMLVCPRWRRLVSDRERQEG